MFFGGGLGLSSKVRTGQVYGGIGKLLSSNLKADACAT